MLINCFFGFLNLRYHDNKFMNFINTPLWLFAVDIHRKQPKNDSETGALLFTFTDYTELEAIEIGGLFDERRDMGDILSDIGYAETAKFGVHLNDEVEKLKQMGFVLFGMRRKLRSRNSPKGDMGVYETASIIAVRQDNPSILGDFLIAKFPTNVSFGF